MNQLLSFWKDQSHIQRIMWSAIFIYVAYFFWFLLENHATNLWDFRVYHTASKAWLNGTDPYVLQNLIDQEAKMLPLPYMYPPLILVLFAPLSFIPIDAASFIYIGLKILALIWLIRIWRDIFHEKSWTIHWVVFLILGFNACIYKDFHTGNISVFEQLLFWIGIRELIKGKPVRFAILLAVLAQAKLLPIAFLVLLIFYGRTYWKSVIVGGGLYAGILSLNFVLFPDLTKSYLSKVSSNAIPEGGIGNASSLEFLRDILHRLDWNHEVLLSTLYAAFVIFILGFSFHKMRQARLTKISLESVMVMILIPVLTLPRMKDYSYIIALLPVFFIALKFKKESYHLLLIFILCILVKNATIPILSDCFDLLWSYYTFIIVFIAWWYGLKHLTSTSDQENVST